MTPFTHATSTFNAWAAIAAVVLASAGGDILLARAMKKIGDVGELRKSRGLFAVVTATLGSQYFLAGVACMALAFYSMLFGLSWNDVSLIGPAAASLTFVANAFAARIFLHERVDGRRWAAALLVAAGVVLMAL